MGFDLLRCAFNLLMIIIRVVLQMIVKTALHHNLTDKCNLRRPDHG